MNEQNQLPNERKITMLEEEVLKLEQEVRYAGKRLEGAERLYDAYFDYMTATINELATSREKGGNLAYRRGLMKGLSRLQRPLLEETAKMRDEFNQAETNYIRKQKELNQLRAGH